jgi:hypothetical protein
VKSKQNTGRIIVSYSVLITREDWQHASLSARPGMPGIMGAST